MTKLWPAALAAVLALWFAAPARAAESDLYCATGTPGPGYFQPASAANPCPTGAAQPANVTPTNCSGTITSGGTAQNAFAAQTTLHGFVIKNIDASAGSGEPLWISFTGTATADTAGSYPLAAPTATTFASGESFSAPVGFALNHALSVVAATTGHKWSCTLW